METLESYTAGGAYAEFHEDRKGRLAPGMFADLVLMSADLEAIDPKNLGAIRPVMTICDGRITHKE